jgi:uncharacterized protein (TIGR02145 family)
MIVVFLRAKPILMKKSLILSLALLFATFACKKDPSGEISINPEEFRPLYEVMQTLSLMESTILQLSKDGASNEEVLNKAANVLRNRPEVSKVVVADSVYAFITLTSGLKTIYSLIPVDENGVPITRGGSTSGGGLFKKLAGGDCSNDIENRKILLFNAEPSFDTERSTRAVIEDNAEKYDLELTRLYYQQCTYDKLTTFGNYGLVIINTHGHPNGFLLGDTVPKSIQDASLSLEEFAKRLNADQDKRLTDLLQLSLHLSIVKQKKFDPNVPIHQSTHLDADDYKMSVTAKAIAQLNLQNTIVFGNMCFSGFSNTSRIALDDLPILTAWQQTNVRAYFGYQAAAGVSRTVSDQFARQMELKFYEALFNDADSTGSAHLDAQGNEYADSFVRDFDKRWYNTYGDLYLRQFFANDYCYQEGCSDTILIDPRDQQSYKVVCIGNQTWMAENLNYAGAGLCFDQNSSDCSFYGRMYTIQETTNRKLSSPGSRTQGICPKGWHVPTKEEFDELFEYVGGESVAGKKLKADTLWPGVYHDPYKFRILPSGRGVNGVNTTLNAGSALFWTATTYVSSIDTAFGMIDFHHGTEYPTYRGERSGGVIHNLACRCVKD